jgi:GNAT superfamily N-acetyltransferase
VSVSSNPAVESSLDNYIQFLRFFRGAVTRRDDRVVIESDRPEFTMLIPLQPRLADGIESFSGTILAPPWLDDANAWLSGLARRKVAEIVFMSKPIAAPGAAEEHGVRVARTTHEIAEFSLVQSRGFIEDPEEFPHWHAWLEAANLRNHVNERCHFLIADRDGQPAAVTLLVESAAACGIYAVATCPEHRRKGLATTLLGACEAKARDLGYRTTSLQVYAGTDAHGFYSRKGFTEDYRVAVWRA